MEDSVKIHRRGSTFYTKSILELTTEDVIELELSKDYIGIWETNQYISSDEYTNYNEIYELTKVKKVEKTIIINVWEPC